MTRNVIRIVPPRLAALTTLLLFGSCVAESGPTAPEFDPQTMEARGGKGGGNGGGSITVTSTEPGDLPQGAQGVGLTVRGSGFEPGSALEFELDGASAAQITVLDVVYVDENRLSATVDVAEDAPETLYDVVVRNGPKKKGVGIDLLKIVPEFVIPVLEGTPAVGDFTDPAIYDAMNGLVIGRDDVCGFVYEVATATKHCISAPGLKPRIVPKAINGSGRIVGNGYLLGVDGGGATDAVPFVVDWPSTTATILPIPEGWEGASLEGINEAGDIMGDVARWQEVCSRKRNCLERRYALARWAPDGSVAAVSAVGGSARVSHGVSDAGQTVASFNQEAVVWDGQDGTTPTPLDDGGLGSIGRDYLFMGANGSVFGSIGVGNGDRIVYWPSPSGAPSVYSDFNVTLRGPERVPDATGNILARDEINGSTICIASNGSATRLATPEGTEYSYAEVSTSGRAFGVGLVSLPDGPTERTLTFWDISGGC